MYLNTSNGDVYQKEESGWTLKMNIQGEDGEDGKDGANGSNGSTGPKGETAWSNTILPSENGYVVPSIGSGVKGTTFTINAYPSTNYYLKSLTLIDKEGNLTSPSYSLDETTNVVVSEEVSMVEGGYVISASFESTQSLGTTGYVDGTKYNGSYDAAGNFVPNLDNPVSDAPTFEGGDGKSEETALEVGSAEQLNEINKVEETYFKLNSDIETTSLTLSGSGVEGDTYEKVIDLNENTMKFTTTSSSFVVNKGLDLTLKNGTIDSNEENGIASIGLGDRTNKNVSGGTLNLEGMTLNNLNNGIVIESKGSELNIKDTTINSAIMPLSTNASLGKDVTDVSITVDNSKLISKGDETNHDGVGLLINTNVDVNIVNNSYIEGPRQALIVRGGNVNIEDSTICFSNTYKGDDTEFDNVWESGNEVAYAGIVIGDTSTTSYDYPASLTLSNVIYSRSNPSSNEVTTLSEESEPYDIYMYGESETNTATLNIDSSTYAQFDSSNIYKNEHSFINVTGVEATSTNAFVDGQLYSELYLKDDGSVDETLSTKVDGVKFAGGDGLSEETALLISDASQFSLINNEKVIETGVTYFKVSNESKNLTYEGSLPIDGRTNTYIDLTDTKLTLNNAGVTNVGSDTDENAEEVKLTLKGNGEAKIDYNNSSTSVTQTSIAVNYNGNLKVDGVNIESTGGPIGLFFDGANVKVNNSILIAADNKGQSYAISSNASNWQETEVNITVTNSILVANTPIMLNVKGKLNVDNSILNGCRQGVLVRSGEANIKNSKINFSGLQPYQNTNGINTYFSNEWKTGNSTPSAAIVIGNRHTSSYLNPATVTIENCDFMRIPLDLSVTSPVNYYETFEEQIDGIFKLRDEKDIVTDKYQERMDYLLYVYQNSQDQLVTVDLDKTSFDNLSSDYSFNNGATIKVDGVALENEGNN